MPPGIVPTSSEVTIASFMQVLGTGSCGTVWLMADEADTPRAYSHCHWRGRQQPQQRDQEDEEDCAAATAAAELLRRAAARTSPNGSPPISSHTSLSALRKRACGAVDSDSIAQAPSVCKRSGGSAPMLRRGGVTSSDSAGSSTSPRTSDGDDADVDDADVDDDECSELFWRRSGGLASCGDSDSQMGRAKSHSTLADAVLSCATKGALDGGLHALGSFSGTITAPSSASSSAEASSDSGGTPERRSLLRRALKVSPRSVSTIAAQATSEQAVIAQLHNPYIVRFHGSSSDDYKTYLCVEAAVGGDLQTLLRVDRTLLSEAQARLVASCLCSALGYLHGEGIVYRDIKPENIVLDDAGLVQLIDFGLTKRLPCRADTVAAGSAEDERTYTLCGTPEYVAPEVIQMQGHSFEVDWWGLGILTYELLHGYTPFSLQGTACDDVMELYRRITHPDVKVDYASCPTSLSQPVLSLMKRLLRRKPSTRLGSKGAAEVRAHDFFSGVDWEAVEQRDQPRAWPDAPLLPRRSSGVIPMRRSGLEAEAEAEEEEEERSEGVSHVEEEEDVLGRSVGAEEGAPCHGAGGGEARAALLQPPGGKAGSVGTKPAFAEAGDNDDADLTQLLNEEDEAEVAMLSLASGLPSPRSQDLPGVESREPSSANATASPPLAAAAPSTAGGEGGGAAQPANAGAVSKERWPKTLFANAVPKTPPPKIHGQPTFEITTMTRRGLRRSSGEGKDDGATNVWEYVCMY